MICPAYFHGPQGGAAYRIRYVFRDSACGIGENVAAVALVEPGPFFVEVFVISEYSAFGKFLRSAEGIFGLNEFVDAILYFFNMISADGKILS